jgi:ATP-dependent DNA helicase RecG
METKEPTGDKRREPRFYMKIAVEVMKKSRPEGGSHDPSPFVGAVLVFPDGSYDTAYRGELREGDHAEYTVLDKKNRHRDTSGCWLFATLEPCAKGSRNSPKISCAERIMNARISDLWFGIEDKNPKVDHEGISYLIDHKVIVHQFYPEFHEEIEKINKEFMTWAKMKNDEAKEKRSIPVNSLNTKIPEANMASLSEIALEKFITSTKRNFKVDSEEFLHELREMELLEFDETTGKYHPTGNAVLLFGKNPRNVFQQAAVKAKADLGNGEVDSESFNDPLVLIPEKIEEWLKKVIPLRSDDSGFKSRKATVFPIKVIREAVVNAIVHRNYDIDGAKVQIEVNTDRIIIKSPGEPLLPITIQALNNFTATSYSRNKKIAFIFNEMDYMEESGFGMDTFRSMNRKYKLPQPVFTYDGINTIITFSRSIEILRKTISNYKINELSDTQIEGLEWIKTKREVSTREYSAHFNIGYKTAQRHLSKMRESGLIGDNGKDVNSPGYKYVIL